MKRLDKGMFRWTKNASEVKQVTIKELRWLCEGLELVQKKAFKDRHPIDDWCGWLKNIQNVKLYNVNLSLIDNPNQQYFGNKLDLQPAKEEKYFLTNKKVPSIKSQKTPETANFRFYIICGLQ